MVFVLLSESCKLVRFAKEEWEGRRNQLERPVKTRLGGGWAAAYGENLAGEGGDLPTAHVTEV